MPTIMALQCHAPDPHIVCCLQGKGVYVEAVEGEQYGIQVSSKTVRALVYVVSVDGA